MSIGALNWAFDLELPQAGQKLVLLALANYADENGYAYPSQAALAKKTCLSDRSIRNNLVALEGLGLIARESRVRQNGSKTSDMFRLNVGDAPKVDQDEEELSTPPGNNFRTPPEIVSAPPGNNFRTPPEIVSGAIEEPSDLTITRTTKKHTAGSARALLAKFGLPDDLAQQWIRVRKAKRLALTELAVEGVVLEAEKAGLTLEQAVRMCCKEGWGGFKASWVQKAAAGRPQQGAPPWWSSEASIVAKGRELGLSARPGESMGDFKGRIGARLAESAETCMR